MFTKEELISVGVEKLAEIVLSLQQNRPDIKKKLKIILADCDLEPKKTIAIIKKKIQWLKQSVNFIDYDDEEYSLRDVSNSLAGNINRIHTLIMQDVKPKSPHQAIELMSNLLDIDEEILEHGDFIGTVEDAFLGVCADLGRTYELITSSLDDVVKLVHDHFMNNKYGVYDDIIHYFKDVLGDNGLKLLKQRLDKSLLEKKEATIKYGPKIISGFIVNDKTEANIMSGLKTIADIQNDVDAYIQACSIAGKPDDDDHLEFAKRLITHQRYEEAIHWLDSMEDHHGWHSEEKHSLKIQALDSCGNYKEAKAERVKLFEITLSFKVYQEILMHAEADFIVLFKKTAVQKALESPNSIAALVFLKETQEFETAAKLVCQKLDNLNPYHDHELRPLADILCKIHPLAATLLYRKLIELPLKCNESRYYIEAAKDLASCHILCSKVTDWQGHDNHQLYLAGILVQLKRKSSFWFEYTCALNKKMAEDAK